MKLFWYAKEIETTSGVDKIVKVLREASCPHQKPYWVMIKEWCENNPHDKYCINDVAKAVFDPRKEPYIYFPNWAETTTLFAVCQRPRVFNRLGGYTHFKLRHPKPLVEETPVDQRMLRARLRQVERVVSQTLQQRRSTRRS